MYIYIHMYIGKYANVCIHNHLFISNPQPPQKQ